MLTYYSMGLITYQSGISSDSRDKVTAAAAGESHDPDGG